MQRVPCCAYRWLNTRQLADEFTYLGSAIAVRRKCRKLFAYTLCRSFVMLYFLPANNSRFSTTTKNDEKLHDTVCMAETFASKTRVSVKSLKMQVRCFELSGFFFKQSSISKQGCN